MDSPIPKRVDLSCDLDHAAFFPLTLDEDSVSLSCTGCVFARWENCLVKLPHSLEFECFIFIRIVFNNSKFFSINFVAFSLVELSYYDGETL